MSESEYGTRMGHLQNAQVIKGDDEKFFVVPQASTRFYKEQLMELYYLLSTLESISK